MSSTVAADMTPGPAIHLYLVTFNCGRTVITSSFVEHLLDGLTAETKAPDLLVLSLQEIAPIAPSFLGGSYLDPYFHTYAEAVLQATRKVVGEEYTLVARSNVGMTGLMVFTRDGERKKVRRVEYAGVGCGLWEMGNKGGVGVKVVYSPGLPEPENDTLEEERSGENVVFNFVGVHLAPHEWLTERRNQDWEAIVRGLVFEKTEEDTTPFVSEEANADQELNDPKYSGIYSLNAHSFVLGDFNYRTSENRPIYPDHERFPKPGDSASIEELHERDQLKQQRQLGKTLHGFEEAEITFPPTYKFKTNKDETYSETEWKWANNRWPSWTDRVLYLPLTGTANDGTGEICIHRYTSLPHIMSSDHKPVALAVSVPATPLNASASNSAATPSKDLRINPPFPLNEDWKQRRAAARSREIAVGLAAFSTTTWAGAGVLIALAGGALGIFWLLQELGME